MESKRTLFMKLYEKYKWRIILTISSYLIIYATITSPEIQENFPKLTILGIVFLALIMPIIVFIISKKIWEQHLEHDIDLEKRRK